MILLNCEIQSFEKKNASTKQVKKYIPWMIVSPRIAFKIRFMLEVLPSKTNWSIVDRDDF